MSTVKVVVRAEILPRDFLQTPGNYYLPLATYYCQNSKIERISQLKKIGQFLKVLTVKLPIFKNKRTPRNFDKS